jgi:hypothetical protein
MGLGIGSIREGVLRERCCGRSEAPAPRFLRLTEATRPESHCPWIACACAPLEFTLSPDQHFRPAQMEPANGFVNIKHTS